MSSLPVLIVDDDAAFRRAWTRLLSSEGYAPLEAADPEQARERFSSSSARLVLLDLMLPPTGTAEEGERLLDEMLAKRPGTQVIVVSGADEVKRALSLVQRGAWDFLVKPADPDVVLAVLRRAAARIALEDRVKELETTITSRSEEGLVGAAPPFLEARELARRAAPTEVPVLITGESGTGKEVFARFVHAQSRRASAPFVALNCGALSPTLIESTLFGHKKGAFTGAVADAPGLFVAADKGTLFLDEIGDLPLELQVKLLRVLETGEVLPVGATRAVQVDVRIVSATHRPLADMIAERAFRDDLYWRIRGIEVALPRLAERPGDVLVLAQHFLNTASPLARGAGPARLSPAAQRCLEDYGWPGNLRELRHEVQRALVMAAGRSELLPEDFSPALRGAPPSGGAAVPEGATLEQKIEALERRELVAALDATQGNRSQAAERLGLSRQGLLNKMARFGLR